MSAGDLDANGIKLWHSTESLGYERDDLVNWAKTRGIGHMILDDGTDTDKVMIRAVRKQDNKESVGPLSTYVQNHVPRTSIIEVLDYWNGPKGNGQWIYSVDDPESALQEILSICKG